MKPICINKICFTVVILNFQTDRFGRTQIRLLLEEEQSDQGLQCLLVQWHNLGVSRHARTSKLDFYYVYSKVCGVLNFSKSTVLRILQSIHQYSQVLKSLSSGLIVLMLELLSPWKTLNDKQSSGLTRQGQAQNYETSHFMIKPVCRISDQV